MEHPAVLTKRINEFATAYRQSLILFSAVDANLFSLLEEERTAPQVAKAVGWDARGTRMLLDTLVALELLRKSGDRYRNAHIATACLVPGSPAYQGNIVKHLKGCMAAWLRLDEALKRGTGVWDEPVEHDPDELRHFILGMSDIAKMSARELLEKVDLAPFRHVLDLGGGPASYSIAFLEAHPNMRATLFDRPEVIPIAREQVHAAQLDSRFNFLQGDMLENDIGNGYDLILVSNIIHSFGVDANRRLIQKCADALLPGGLLIVKDFLVEPDRSGPAFGLFFALHMFVNTEQGDTYSIDDLNAWAQGTTLGESRVIDVAANSRLWLARRKAES